MKPSEKSRRSLGSTVQVGDLGVGRVLGSVDVLGGIGGGLDVLGGVGGGLDVLGGGGGGGDLQIFGLTFVAVDLTSNSKIACHVLGFFQKIS